jgi:hypothetical protein
MTAVLHTWGQNLSRHVHVHCLIPGGVLTGTKPKATTCSRYGPYPGVFEGAWCRC